MDGTSGIGKLLLVVGALMMLLGAVFVLGPRIPFLGRLPGDILIQRDGATFYFPLVTMIILSVVLTILLNVAARIFR